MGGNQGGSLCVCVCVCAERCASMCEAAVRLLGGSFEREAAVRLLGGSTEREAAVRLPSQFFERYSDVERRIVYFRWQFRLQPFGEGPRSSRGSFGGLCYH